MYISQLCQKSNIVYKANQHRSNNYKQIAEKRAYIDAKTNILEELAIFTFLGAFVMGVLDIKNIIKEQKINKLGIGLLISSATLLVAKWIKQVQLSKQYDKELKND